MAFLAPLAMLGGTLAAGGTAATALTAGASILGGVTAMQAGNYQAAVAKQNAEVATQNAENESLAMQQQQMRSDHEYAAQIGEQTAIQAASGLDILGRSQFMARDVTARTGQEQAMDIRLQGENKARGLLQDAANFRAEAKQAKTQGMLSMAGAVMEAGGIAAKDPGIKRTFSSIVGRKATKVMPWTRKANWYGRG